MEWVSSIIVPDSSVAPGATLPGGTGFDSSSARPNAVANTSSESILQIPFYSSWDKQYYPCAQSARFSATSDLEVGHPSDYADNAYSLHAPTRNTVQLRGKYASNTPRTRIGENYDLSRLYTNESLRTSVSTTVENGSLDVDNHTTCDQSELSSFLAWTQAADIDSTGLAGLTEFHYARLDDTRPSGSVQSPVVQDPLLNDLSHLASSDHGDADTNGAKSCLYTSSDSYAGPLPSKPGSRALKRFSLDSARPQRSRSSSTSVITDQSLPSQARGGRAARTPRYTAAAWKQIKPIFAKYYLDDNMRLEDVIQILSRDHDFHATPKMYKSHITYWGLFKNVEKAQKIFVNRFTESLSLHGAEDERSIDALSELRSFCTGRKLRLETVLPSSAYLGAMDCLRMTTKPDEVVRSFETLSGQHKLEDLASSLQYTIDDLQEITEEESFASTQAF